MKKNVLLNKFIIVAGLLLLVALAALAVYLTTDDDLTDVNVVIEKVSRHIILPADEKPALLAVADRSKVKASFLQVTKTDDKVLIYEKHQVAVIYRPSRDRIVDIAKIEIGDPTDDAPRAAWPEKLP